MKSKVIKQRISYTYFWKKGEDHYWRVRGTESFYCYWDEDYWRITNNYPERAKQLMADGWRPITFEKLTAKRAKYKHES